ncbi:MAG: hypothetical protein GY812_12455 [Actinomycetia bacterium]|nr:hypothetical protein [Actinomycetes bacterium]
MNEPVEPEEPDLGAVLRAALQVPDDVTANARTQVDQTLKGRSLTSTVTDIAGSGLATVWHLLTNAPDTADSIREDEHD